QGFGGPNPPAPFPAREGGGSPLSPRGRGLGEGFTNSLASQSSSSGWLGRSPWTPKSSVVFTSPVPKNVCQKRFTVARAVSGLSGETIQFATARRFRGASFGSGGRLAGTPGSTFVSGLS